MRMTDVDAIEWSQLIDDCNRNATCSFEEGKLSMSVVTVKLPTMCRFSTHAFRVRVSVKHIISVYLNNKPLIMFLPKRKIVFK